jgi:hypothetical protein
MLLCWQEKHLSSFEILQAFLQVEKLICNQRFIAGVSAPVKGNILSLRDKTKLELRKKAFLEQDLTNV